MPPLNSAQAAALTGDLGGAVAFSDGRLNAIKNVDNQNAQVVPYVRGQLARARAVVARVAPAGDRVAEVVNLLNYLRAAASPQAGLDEAELVIVTLGLPWNALTANNYPNTTLVRTAWPHLTPLQQAAVAEVARSRAPNAAVRSVVELSAAGAGVVLTNLQTLAALVAAVNLVRPGDGQRFSGITPRTLPDLAALRVALPPGGGFAGFTQWGPGDHGQSERNIRWHFLKHVCAMTDNENADTDPRECALWWRRLAIQLTWAQFNQNITRHERPGDVQGWFTGANQSLSYARVEEFLRRGTLSNNPALLGHLLTTYQNTYRDDAITASAGMTEVLIQTNGVKTFVTGADDRDDMFIIGRLDAGTLGISSSYIASDLDEKMRGARSNRIWQLI